MSGPQCDEYQELVSASVDERLDGPELLRLEEHLRDCPACREFDGGLRRLPGLLQALETVDPLRRPSPGFAARVAALAAAQSRAGLVVFPAPRSPWRATGARWLGLATAAAAALVFLWSWQRLPVGDSAAQRFAGPAPAPVAVASADGGSMDAWAHEHAQLARGSTILGRAEEVEFASFARAVGPER